MSTITIQELRSRLILLDGKLLVGPNLLNSAGVTAFLTAYTAAGLLQVEGAALQSTDADNFVRFTGSAMLLNTVLTIGSATFYIDALTQEAALKLDAWPAAGWHFATSFPALSTSYFNRFQLENVGFVFASHLVDGHDKGLFFAADFTPPPLWEVLRWFANPGQGARLTGPIMLQNGQPEMRLSVVPVIKAALGTLEIELTLVNSSKTYLDKQRQSVVATFSQLLGALTFTHAGAEQAVALAATFGEELSVLKLDITAGKNLNLSFSDISHWFGGVDVSTQGMPSFYTPTQLSLQDISFAVGLVTKRLEYVTLVVAAAEPWVIIDQVLSFEQLVIHVMLVQPPSSTIIVSFQGIVNIAGIVLDVHAQVPDFEVVGQLSNTVAAPNLSVLITNLLGAPSRLPGNITVTDLAFTAHPSRRNYSFAISVDSDWVVGGSATIGALLFEVVYEGGNSAALTTIVAKGFFTIAAIDVLVAAQYQSDSAGWHFSGATGPGQDIPIGQLMADLGDRFGISPAFPLALAGLMVKNVQMHFDTTSSDATFSCELKFPVEGRELDLTLDIALTHVDGKYEKTFKGTLLLADRQFDLDFDTGGDTTTFWGDYENTGGQALAVGDLVALLSTDAGLQAAVQGLEFNLKDAFAGYLKSTDPGAPAKWLLGLDMDFGADLTALPLVGKFVPKDEALRLVVQPRIATLAFSDTDMKALKALAGPAIALPDTFAQGLTLHLELSLGGTAVPLSLPISAQSVQPTGQRPTIAGGTAPALATPAPVDKATWVKLQKSFGPLALERVGVLYESGQLTFLLDGGFSVAGLTIALTGLSATTRLKPFQLSFGLQGLALDYKGGPAEISGAFLREELKDELGVAYTAYNGAALLKAESFTLSAIGSYADYQGHPSMFIYAVLDSPLGGPAFFFVTGLAAGFGFNRALKIPGIDQVQNFPLVSRAVSGPDGGDGDIGAQMRRLNEYIPPAVGEYFLAVGIRFTTFKIIDSFALLVVSLGSRLEIDLLGLSTLVLPAQTDGAVPPLAELQMVLKASYLPDVGFLSVEAKLTPASFLFSHDCHLTGGFAFYTWFAGDHKDDFAVTLGGYHPSYQRPAHYPVVDKLAFNWVLSDRLTIKGDAYFALVPSMVMAGTHLSAVWEDGNLSAWFNAGADFLIAWKPYHYDAQLYVDMGVSYTYHFFGTHHISVDVGADLHIWGPEFAGTARVHLWIVSFTVDFGSSSASQPTPIAWDDFHKSFLPDPALVCSLAVKQGLEKKDGPGSAAHPVVSPKGFTLSFNSAIPLKTASLKADGDAAATALGGGATGWGVGPMGLAAAEVASDVAITLTNLDGHPVHASQLLVVPTAKAVPVALWGQAVSPALNGSPLIEGAVCGFDICGVAPTPGQTAAINHEKLELELEDMPSTAWRWASAPASGATAAEQQLNAPTNETARRDYLRTHLEADQAARSELLRQLGFTTPVFPDQSLAQAFVIAPQLA